MNRHPIKTLLFDLDGTLVDSREDIALSVNHTLSVFGKPALPTKTVEEYVGGGVRHLLSLVLGPMDPPTADKALGIFLPHYLEHCTDTVRLYPGVRETLEKFTDKNMAVITNKPEAHTHKTLRAVGVERFFKVVLAADSLPKKKPSPEPLWEALARLGADRSQAMMVGDSPVDIQAARAAGVPVTAVTYGFRIKSELADHRPDFLIDTFSKLEEVVL